MTVRPGYARLLAVLIVLAVAGSLATATASRAGAQQSSDLQAVVPAQVPDIPGVEKSIIEAIRDPHAPLEKVDPARYLPDPVVDPWYSNPPRLDPATPNGTILASRPTSIPLGNAFGVGNAWQMLVQTRDSHDNPVAVPSTVIEPALPWRGPGPRPVIGFAAAIDSLGNDCQPSWSMTTKFTFQFPPLLQILVSRGYAVVMTDHHGPRGAYAASRMNAHAILDGIRAARSFPPARLDDSPVAIFGYSGGGFGAGMAAQIQKAYAPEMSEYLVATTFGGVPLELSEALPRLDGTLGSGLMLAAILGLAREYPEMYGLLNKTGDAVAYNLRNQCSFFHTFAGFTKIRLNTLTVNPDPIADPRVRAVVEANKLGIDPRRPDERPDPNVPVLLFSTDKNMPIGPFPGLGDKYFPESRLRELGAQWCSAGANVDYVGAPGEHVTGMFSLPQPVFDWIDRRFDERATGRPAPNACRA